MSAPGFAKSLQKVAERAFNAVTIYVSSRNIPVRPEVRLGIDIECLFSQPPTQIRVTKPRLIDPCGGALRLARRPEGVSSFTALLSHVIVE